MDNKVKIVIPVYKEKLGERELLSLKNNVTVLEKYPVAILAPEGLDVSDTLKYIPQCEVVYVSDQWLGANGIAGYNNMMLSEEFYRLFQEYEYILICQTDAWIFRDELALWCSKGYDYIGAPWPKRKVYTLPVIKQFLWLRKKLFSKEGKLMRQDYFNKVGNGGLSLRRIPSFIDGCKKYKERADIFKQNRGMLHNEDWFWALVPKEFKYPSFDEALGFSFDTHPDLCLSMNKGKLPFGCHGWYKKRNYNFWRNYINDNPQQI